jgi:hypothetical protein
MKNIMLFFTMIFGSCDFPKVVSNSFVKEFCSCYYVVGQSEKYCYDYALQSLKISKYEIQEQAKTITASGYGFSGEAQFISKEEGCRLTPLP